MLARHLVILLNSPPHYPPYNGGMECAVRELKIPLVEKVLITLKLFRYTRSVVP